MRTEYSIFNTDWYMRNTYDVAGSSLGAGNKVEFCTNHITFALVKFIRNCRCDALYQEGNTRRDKGLLWSRSQKRPC